MNRDDIIRMAYEASDGVLSYDAEGRWILSEQEVIQLAALVAAEKDKEIARLREENVYLKGVYDDLVEDRKELFDDLDKAVAAEREACAKENAELLQALQNLHQRCHWADAPEEMDAAKAAIEKAIRARGEV